MSNVVCIYHGSQTILFLPTKYYTKCQQIYIGAPSVRNLILYHYWEIYCLQNCDDHILIIRNHCPAAGVRRSSNLGTEETVSAITGMARYSDKTPQKSENKNPLNFPQFPPLLHCSQNESTVCSLVHCLSRLKLALICNNKHYKGKLFLSHPHSLPPSLSLRFSPDWSTSMSRLHPWNYWRQLSYAIKNQRRASKAPH